MVVYNVFSWIYTVLGVYVSSILPLVKNRVLRVFIVYYVYLHFDQVSCSLSSVMCLMYICGFSYKKLVKIHFWSSSFWSVSVLYVFIMDTAAYHIVSGINHVLMCMPCIPLVKCSRVCLRLFSFFEICIFLNLHRLVVYASSSIVFFVICHVFDVYLRVFI